MILEIDLPKFLSRIYVLTSVLIAWTFFRANSVSDAFHVLQCSKRNLTLGLGEIPIHLIFEASFFVTLLLIFESNGEEAVWDKIRHQKGHVRWAVYTILILFYLFTAQVAGKQFIYFQF